MVDQNGKLLAGQSRDIPFTKMDEIPSDTTSNPIHIANSKTDDLPDIFHKHKNMYLFYSDYFLWVIGKCIVNLEDLENRFYSMSRAESGKHNHILRYLDAPTKILD